MTHKITVLLVDDHPLFREGVAQTLATQADIEVVGQASSAQEAIRLACDLLPDIALLDINIPGSGLQAAHCIARECPVVKIVMLTGSDEDENLMAALRLGARGYILKGVSAAELVQILRAICAGDVYVPPALAANLLLTMTGTPQKTASATAHSEDLLDDLTPRETGILEWVATGHSNKEIARRLNLSEKTVKHHMTNILQKLQVRNRVEAALLAQRSEQKGYKNARH